MANSGRHVVAGVLEGIRVLDFGRYIAGPFCAALLGDLGAEVIRVERIGGGEDRGFIPVGAGPDGGGAMFLAMNRNKLGMTLDPAAPRGREIVQKLVATADVVVANLPPQVLRSLALDLDSLRRTKPDIILTTVTGFAVVRNCSRVIGSDAFTFACPVNSEKSDGRRVSSSATSGLVRTSEIVCCAIAF